MVAKRGAELETTPEWAFYQQQVPKYNAMLMLGNYDKVLAIRRKVMADFNNRYVHSFEDPSI